MTCAPAAKLWEFHTIPQKGEPGYETWLNGSADYTGNTGVWTEITADPEAGLAYLPVESPTSDFYGGKRPGNNLYANSPGGGGPEDRQDRNGISSSSITKCGTMTCPRPPLLMDITVNGKPIKAVAEPTKMGMLYVFDRITGKPVWPIPEKPAPKGNVPGEWYAPTQPMPSKPGALCAHRRQRGRVDRLHARDARRRRWIW